MEKYWAIAQSHKYPDIFIKEIEAESEAEAITVAEKWRSEQLGFRYDLVVARELFRK